MFQLSSLETAKHKQQCRTSQVQMLGIRVLSASLAHKASRPILKPTTAPMQAMPCNPFHSSQVH